MTLEVPLQRATCVGLRSVPSGLVAVGAGRNVLG